MSTETWHIDPARRAQVVAALREIADLLEGDAALPVPFTGSVQASVGYSLEQSARFAALRGYADRLGVDVVETPSGSRRARVDFGPISYVVHVNPDRPGGAARPDRVVPAAEDAALTAGRAVDAA